MLSNPARVMRQQLKVLAMPSESRYAPVKPVTVGGIIMLRDCKPAEREDLVVPVEGARASHSMFSRLLRLSLGVRASTLRATSQPSRSNPLPLAAPTVPLQAAPILSSPKLLVFNRLGTFSNSLKPKRGCEMRTAADRSAQPHRLGSALSFANASCTVCR